MQEDTLKFNLQDTNKDFNFTRQKLTRTASPSKNAPQVSDHQAARFAVKEIIQASLQAVDPKAAVKRFLTREGNVLKIDGKVYNLDEFEKVMVFGAGKASAFMAQAVTEIVPEVAGGLVITKDKHGLPEGRTPGNVDVREAAHPKPNQAGLDSTEELLQKAQEVKAEGGKRNLFIVVKSGGGSALLEKLAGDLTLSDLEALTVALQSKPLTINEVNAVRKHISSVKGGQLGKYFSEIGATTINLILSDVIGDNLEVIASGPTVPDPTTYQDAWDILERHDLIQRLQRDAPNVLSHLKKGIAGEIPETPTENLPNVHNVIVANNRLAAEAAADKAAEQGFDAFILTDELTGEVADASKGVLKIAKDLAQNEVLENPVCLVLGGETTVELGENPGIGGRNQDLAVRSGISLKDVPNVLIAHYGTDGTDGNNGAAGGFADSELIAASEALGLEPQKYLEGNDTYNLLKQLGDDYHIVLGPTGTNVCDITLILAWPIEFS